MTAFGTVAVFQAGVITGYKIWYYIIITITIFISFKYGLGFFRIPGFKWWLLLCLLGSVHLLFIENDSAYVYSRNMVVNIAAGLSAFAIAYHLRSNGKRDEEIRQLTFLIMVVTSVALLVPMLLQSDSSARLGVETGMDANGVGITAVYSFLCLLIYASQDKKKTLIVGLFVLFLVIVVVRTASRQAVSAILLLLGIYFFISLRGKIKFQYLIVVTSILIGLSIFASTANLPYLQNRFEKVMGPSGSIDRLDHLKMSLYMAADHPFGIGGGGFREHFSEYKYKAGIVTIHNRLVPHTLFGMVIAEWGIPGAVLLFGGFLLMAKHIFTLKGFEFRIKLTAFLVYFFLANAGMVFPPVLMALLGMRSSATQGKAVVRKLRW